LMARQDTQDMRPGNARSTAAMRRTASTRFAENVAFRAFTESRFPLLRRLCRRVPFDLDRDLVAIPGASSLQGPASRAASSSGILRGMLSRVLLIHPALTRPFHRDGGVYEEKYDGWRLVVYKTGGHVGLVSRRGVVKCSNAVSGRPPHTP
jgi:hypothetical protein